eukprot:7961009-Pyramimonas_sp.AAC.1
MAPRQSKMQYALSGRSTRPPRLPKRAPQGLPGDHNHGFPFWFLFTSFRSGMSSFRRISEEELNIAKHIQT